MAKWEMERDEMGATIRNEMNIELLPLTNDMWERLTEPYMDGNPFNNCRVEESLSESHAATVDFYINIDPEDPPGDELRDGLQNALDELPSLWIVVTTDDDSLCDLRFFNLHFHLGEFTGSILNLARRLRKAAKVVDEWTDKARRENPPTSVLNGLEPTEEEKHG